MRSLLMRSLRRRTRRADQSIQALECRRLLSADLPVKLLADLEPNGPGSLPQDFASNGSVTYFTTHNRQKLWTTDGTEEGTVLLREGTFLRMEDLFVTPDGTLFFHEDRELWKSDGTVAGTALVKNGFTRFDGFPEIVATGPGSIAFVATTGAQGTELWFSDGTESGTVTEDLNPGAGDSSPGGLTPVPIAPTVSGVLFHASTPAAGREPWVSAFTTRMAADINPGPGSSLEADTQFALTDEAFYFAATTGGARHLWVSDGTEEGTELVSSAATLATNQIITDGEAVYASASSSGRGTELWRYEPGGAFELVRDIRPGSFGSSPDLLGMHDGTLYFAANDGTHGEELWKSDGSAIGTQLVADVWDGASSSSPSDLGELNGTLVFKATDAEYGRELRRTDGTASGTDLLLDIAPGEASGVDVFVIEDPSSTLGQNTTDVYLVADDGIHGPELWRTQGTGDTTVLVRDFEPGPGSSSARDTYATATHIYFNESGPRVTDGVSVLPFPDAAQFRDFAVLNGETYFVDFGALHRLNADGVSATRIRTISRCEYLVEAGGKLFIGSSSALWVSDGTTEGTTQISNQGPDWLVPAGNAVYFAAFLSGVGVELFRSDGTVGGTRLVRDIVPGTGSSRPEPGLAVGSQFFFIADTEVGKELWATNGTNSGTRLVRDILPGSGDGVASGEMAAVGNHVYFSANDGVAGRELWISDGSDAGTRVLRDIDVGPGSSVPSSIRQFGSDQFVFGARNPITGFEIYVSDGTTVGTQVLKDVGPGANPFLSPWLTVAGDTIFWSADDGSGPEPWMSDGTPDGTRRIADVLPGADGSEPSYFAFSEQHLLFVADGSGVGREPHILEYVDYGDAPAPYPTSNADDGARHGTAGGMSMGSVDAEFEAKSDDADSGVSPSTLTPGSVGTAFVDVDIVGSAAGGRVDAWIDFNQDGDWSDHGEQVADGAFVANGGEAISFRVPANAAPGTTWARFRLSSTGGLAPTGYAADGEVEDVIVTINTPPIAVDDEYVAYSGLPLRAYNGTGISHNDFDPDGDPLSPRLLTEPVHGHLEFDTYGVFAYTPNADFVGTDSFVYQISDGRGGTDEARVIVDVQPTVDAVDDELFVTVGDSHTLDLVDNDQSAGPLQILSYDSAPNASLSRNTDGTLQFDGAAGFSGVTGFEYTAALQQIVQSRDDAAANDQFGNDVAVDGTFAVVSSHLDDSSGADSGSAYVFRRIGTDWHFYQKLTASDGAAGDHFGFDLDIWKNTIVVGAGRHDAEGNNAGAVYVFELNEDAGEFEQHRKIVNPSSADGDYFGEAVAIHGGTLAIGARLDDGLGTNSGSVFIFNRHRGGKNNWGYRRRIKASDASTGDQFGYSVDVHRYHVIVGARYNDDNGTNSGAAYVFRRHNGGRNVYGEVTKLLPTTIDSRDEFGHRVAIDRQTAVVSAPRYGSTQGAAWVFNKNLDGRNNWGLEATLADNATNGDNFGSSIDVDNGTIVVGSRTDDPGVSNAGSTYVFQVDESSDEWTLLRRLSATDARAGDQFGTGVAVANNVVVTGASRSDPDGSSSGSVYFDDLTTDTAVVTVTVGSPLHAGSVSVSTGSAFVSHDQFNSLAAVAASNWSRAGFPIGEFSVSFADLDGTMLGLAMPGRVLIDNDAAGHGWYVDQTPHDLSDDNLHGQMDLLTVLEHELGHLAGFSDTRELSKRDHIMFGTLRADEQRAIDGVSSEYGLPELL